MELDFFEKAVVLLNNNKGQFDRVRQRRQRTLFSLVLISFLTASDVLSKSESKNSSVVVVIVIVVVIVVVVVLGVQVQYL